MVPKLRCDEVRQELWKRRFQDCLLTYLLLRWFLGEFATELIDISGHLGKFLELGTGRLGFSTNAIKRLGRSSIKQYLRFYGRGSYSI